MPFVPAAPRAVHHINLPTQSERHAAIRRALDVARGTSYKACDDVSTRDHYSNYRPGALIQTSCRDKAYGLLTPTLTTPIE